MGEGPPGAAGGWGFTLGEEETGSSTYGEAVNQCLNKTTDGYNWRLPSLFNFHRACAEQGGNGTGECASDVYHWTTTKTNREYLTPMGVYGLYYVYAPGYGYKNDGADAMRDYYNVRCLR